MAKKGGRVCVEGWVENALDARGDCCYKRGVVFKNFFMALAVAIVPMVQAQTGAVQELAAELKVGETQVLELPGNPTTGYSWILAAPLPSDCPVSVAVDYEAAESPRGLVGRGGVFKVCYTGVKPGTATVELVYARPWEKGKAPLQKTNLIVTVK